MSWFRKKPKIKEPPKHIPYHTSLATDKMLDRAKESGPQKNKRKTVPDK
jgi:hypothetical protein